MRNFEVFCIPERIYEYILGTLAVLDGMIRGRRGIGGHLCCQNKAPEVI
jgi:hypothetical protein